MSWWEEYRLFFVYDVAENLKRAGWCVVDRHGREMEASVFGAEDVTMVRDVLFGAWDGWRSSQVGIVSAGPAYLTVPILSNWVAHKPSERKFPPHLIDVPTARMMAGKDPLATVVRFAANENPPHDPLADARQSARLFLEAMNTIRNLRERSGDRVELFAAKASGELFAKDG